MQRVDVPDRSPQQFAGRNDVLVSVGPFKVTPPLNAIDPLADALTELVTSWRARQLRDASFAALYFLRWHMRVHGPRFAARRFKHDARPDPLLWMNELSQADGFQLDELLIRYFERYQFLGVIPNVNIALSRWLQDKWPLVLCEHVPAPAEVLDLQARGLRPVTLICDLNRACQPVLGKPDALAFMTHDLEHAYKFFHAPRLHALQRGLFAALLDAQQRDVFRPYAGDVEFRTRFDYLISDMNTHPVHSLQYLRAILVEFHLRIEHAGVADVLSPSAKSDVAETLSKLELGADANDILARLSVGALGPADAGLIEQVILENDRSFVAGGVSA